jgi:hypothetical protein
MTTARSADDMPALMIGTAHDLLNAASGANSAAKRSIKREDRNTPGLYAALHQRLRLLSYRIQAFTEVNGELVHDLGHQGLLDHLHMQRGSLNAALQLLHNLSRS